MEFVTLNNGVKMPKVGFGVYRIKDHKQCKQALLDAIDAGYRLIDTAQSYGNEEAVGKAIQETSVPRNELFITTKVWVANYGYEKTKASVEESLKKMQLDYIDLVLLHQPFNDYYGAYKALEPAVNQVEVNVFHQQIEAQTYNEKYGVQMEAWAPFAEGRNNMFTNPELKAIGDRYGKTVAQVILRWLVQRGIVPLAKSVKKERMQENIDIFDFELNYEDMEIIESMNRNKSCFFDHYNAATVEMIAGLDR